MNESQLPERSTGRDGNERLPDGRVRPLTYRERVRIERTAGLRHENFEDVEREYRRRQ